ncbi:hypothetical protein NMG60_11021091 [Bertholletia excelsa]
MSFSSIPHSPEMKNSQRPGVRQYKKSELPRLRWTPELHDHFVEAVERLGGKYKATPKRILQMMSVRGLKISHIKSHLQMYRSTKDRTAINVLVPMKHWHGSTHDFTDLPLFSICSPRRQLFNEDLRNGRNKNSPAMEKCCNYEHQDMHGSTLSEMSKEEEDFDGLKDTSDRSSVFHESEELYHFNNYQTSQSTEERNFIDHSSCQSIGGGKLNLDLTISTCFSNSK